MLMSLGGVVDAEVVDLFAGSGSFGIEALSRGASHVTFVEQARPALAAIGENLERLGLQERATIVPGSVERIVPTLPAVDLAFCDPPYALDPWPTLLPAIHADLMVGHASTPVELTPEWEEIRRRTYGRACIVIAQRLPPQT